MRHPGRAVSRAGLLDGAWDGAGEHRSNSVDVYVRSLRKKVGRPFGVQSIRDGAPRRLPPRPGLMNSPLRSRDERALARLIRRGDRRAREELIAMHVPMARSLALRYRRRAEPADDLVQVAVVGLVKAVDRWDPDRGVDLRTFATPTVLGELRHYFRDCTWGVRPPRRLQNLSIAIERARDELRSQLGRSPTVADLARRLGYDQETVIEGLRAGSCRWLDSLDAPPRHADEGAASVGELIPVEDRELERVEMRATNERLITVLDAKAREIMRLRFEENMVQSEIAARIGRSQMHVSRVIAASLDKLHLHATACVAGT